MANLVQKFIVEDASKASPILPQHVCFVTADGEPVGISKQAANPGANPTIAKVVKCLVDAGVMAATSEASEQKAGENAAKPVDSGENAAKPVDSGKAEEPASEE